MDLERWGKGGWVREASESHMAGGGLGDCGAQTLPPGNSQVTRALGGRATQEDTVWVEVRVISKSLGQMLPVAKELVAKAAPLSSAPCLISAQPN